MGLFLPFLEVSFVRACVRALSDWLDIRSSWSWKGWMIVLWHFLGSLYCGFLLGDGLSDGYDEGLWWW